MEVTRKKRKNRKFSTKTFILENGKTLKDERARLNLTVKELSEYLHVIPRSIYRWEKGDREPTTESVIFISNRMTELCRIMEWLKKDAKFCIDKILVEEFEKSLKQK